MKQDDPDKTFREFDRLVNGDYSWMGDAHPLNLLKWDVGERELRFMRRFIDLNRVPTAHEFVDGCYLENGQYKRGSIVAQTVDEFLAKCAEERRIAFASGDFF